MVQNIIGDKLVTDRQQTDRQQTDIFELTPIHMGGRERMGGNIIYKKTTFRHIFEN
jgi:hypothetical protein